MADKSPQLPPIQGYAPAAMYTERWCLIEPQLPKGRFTLVDWGSDAGWFSLAVATAFPESDVISVEAGLMTLGEGIARHRDALLHRGIENNVLLHTLFGPLTFDGLVSVPSDYQLALSVFHHMGDGFGRYLASVQEWDAAFCALIRGANTTFFEVPNEHADTETPHRIRTWYADRDVESTLKAALAREDVAADVVLLGETQHGEKGRRKLFRITLRRPRETASPEAIRQHISSVGKRARTRPYRRLKLMALEVKRALGRRG